MLDEGQSYGEGHLNVVKCRVFGLWKMGGKQSDHITQSVLGMRFNSQLSSSQRDIMDKTISVVPKAAIWYMITDYNRTKKKKRENCVPLS